MGHEFSSCFKVVGYPDWWPDKPRNRFKNRGSQAASSGRGRGASPRANHVTQLGSENYAAVGSTSFITESDCQGLGGLTDDPWNIFQRVINAGKSAANSGGKNVDSFWILDTSVTHHITGFINLFDDIEGVVPLSVFLPAGSDVVTSKQGTIRLTPGMSLKNVYFVEGFHMNLIPFG